MGAGDEEETSLERDREGSGKEEEEMPSEEGRGNKSELGDKEDEAE